MRRFVAIAFLCLFSLPVLGKAELADFAELASKQKPSVVNISATSLRAQDLSGIPLPFQYYFRDAPPQERTSLGSGFVISSDGYIATNTHVVEDADEIIVTTSSGAEYKAKVIGTDRKLDLALLKIEASGLKPVTIGNSDTLRVGEWVVAVGSPFGLEQTVTAGIVSAKGRVIGAGPYDDFIQTDASINPGNSGGPLFNIKGEVVGINTAIASPSGGNVGIGFAIPVNLAKPALDELRATGRIRRGYLGVYIEEISKEAMQAMNLSSRNGALVRQVEAGSAAAKAGIQAGDVIVAIDNEEIKRAHDLPIRVARHKPGTKVRVDLIHDGKKKSLMLTVEEASEEKMRAGVDNKAQPRLGLGLTDLTPELAQELGAKTKHGVVVTRVLPGTPAARANIERGDVIYMVNRKPVRNLQDFRKYVAEPQSKAGLQLMVDRHGDQVFIVLRLPKD